MSGPILTTQPNFRDLAGHRGADGRLVQPGRLFRSGELGHLDAGDVATLTDLGIRTVVDLRSDLEEAERGVDVLPAGTELRRVPIEEADRLAALITERFEQGDFAPPEQDLMVEVYRSMARDWLGAFRTVVDVVVDEEHPVVVHCTHGKDRAGLASALLLTALGVDPADVEADFLASNARRAAETAERMVQLRAMVADRFAVDPADVEVEWMRSLFVVDTRYLRAAFDEATARYGSVDALLADGLGLDGARRRALQDRLLD